MHVAAGEGHAGRDEVGTATRTRPRREPVPTTARASDGRRPPDRLSRALFAAVVRTDGSVRKDSCNIPDSLPGQTYSSRRRTVMTGRPFRLTASVRAAPPPEPPA